jgi:hypothetical protein
MQRGPPAVATGAEDLRRAKEADLQVQSRYGVEYIIDGSTKAAS